MLHASHQKALTQLFSPGTLITNLFEKLQLDGSFIQPSPSKQSIAKLVQEYSIQQMKERKRQKYL